MSSHDRGAPGGPPQLLWAFLVIAAALIGGLAAAALVHTSLIVTVIVAVVTGGIAVAVFRSPARPGERPAPSGPAAPSTPVTAAGPAPAPAPAAGPAPAPAPAAGPAPAPAPAAGPAPAPVPAPAPAPGPATVPGSAETAVQLLPLPPTPGEDPSRPAAAPAWWDAAQGGPPPPSPAAQRTPAPALSTYLASTFIAQCPRCGAFRLDIRGAECGWDFRCQSCAYLWTWQPGTPWPPVRVMPGRRRPASP